VLGARRSVATAVPLSLQPLKEMDSVDKISPSPLSRPAHWARRGLVLDAWLLVLALLGQLYTAGMAVFANPGWWARHRELVHGFQWLVPIALVLAFVGRSSRAVKGLAGIALVLLFLQYTTADLRLAAATQRLAALHTVTAALLFWAATELARRTLRAGTAAGR
jgi:hypothetical protein